MKTWDARAAQVWFLQKATTYLRDEDDPDRARVMAECSVTWGSCRTEDGFRASVRSCGINEEDALAEVAELSGELP